ncbi:GDSL-type esterase/lipase family protein [Streptomyces zhihengii]|uniref:SGNH/GDSL hydrolase family protein n=1 Tax=Streptomyces zhihengii TaxID=1818004 RepID=UPI0034536600
MRTPRTPRTPKAASTPSAPSSPNPLTAPGAPTSPNTPRALTTPKPPTSPRPGARLRALLAVSALCAAAFAAPGATATAAAADRTPLRYVALGDSFAAAPLVRPADPADPACVRSLAGYPRVAASLLGATLTDVSCSGATAEHLSTRQYPGTAPQYDALTEDTDLVSITLGGNDTALFNLATGCVNLLPKPLGRSCAATHTAGGKDTYADAVDAWAPEFAAVLDTVARRAPHARIFVVGYGAYFRPGGCFPVQPFWAQDADYVQRTVDRLGTVLRTVAERHGATFVDTAAPGAGHDSCAAPADRWIEGAVSTRDAFPLHPNAAGSRAYGTALATAVHTSPTLRDTAAHSR